MNINNYKHVFVTYVKILRNVFYIFANTFQILILEIERNTRR